MAEVYCAYGPHMHAMQAAASLQQHRAMHAMAGRAAAGVAPTRVAARRNGSGRSSGTLALSARQRPRTAFAYSSLASPCLGASLAAQQRASLLVRAVGGSGDDGSEGEGEVYEVRGRRSYVIITTRLAWR